MGIPATKDDLLSELRGARKRLTIFVAGLRPKTTAEQAQLDALVAQQDLLSDGINNIIEHDFAASTASLPAAIAQLQHLNAQLDSAKHEVDQVHTALTITNKVLGVIAQVVGFLV